MKRFLSAFLLTLSLATQAGLPPTSSKVSGESVYSTTFKTDFGTFKGTRSGTTLTLNSIGAGVGDSLALGGTKAASAILDVQSTTQGVLPPRMTTAQMNAISSPANGLTVYNTDYNSLASYNSTSAVWTYGFGSLNVATPRTAYTPTFTGFGTVSGVDCNYARDGEFLDLDCKFTSGTPTATEARISLPSGLLSSSLGGLRKAGGWDTTDSASTFFYISPLIEPSVSYITVGSQTSVTGSLGKLNGDSVTSSGKTHSFNVRVPTAGWSSNTSAWVLANSNPIATTTTFGAYISSSCVVTGDVADFINGNGVLSGTSICTFTLNTALNLTQGMSCNGNANFDASNVLIGINIPTSSTTQIVTVARNDAGIQTANPFYLTCTKLGADYTAAHSPFIIGSFAGTPKVPGYFGLVDHWDVSYGATATTVCSSAAGVVCPYIKTKGTALVSGGEIKYGSGGGIYDMFFNQTYSEVWCQGIVFQSNTATAIINNSLQCSNCSSLSFRTLTSNQSGAVDTWGSLKCTGYR